MSISEKELFEHLSYSKCDCPIARLLTGYINGVCPMHGGRLLIDGRTVEEHRRMIAGEAVPEKKKSRFSLVVVLILFALLALVVLINLSAGS